MVRNPMVHVSTSPTVLSSSLMTLPGSSSNCMPYLPFRSKKRINRIRAMTADARHDQPSSTSEAKNPLKIVLDLPCTVWRQTLRPLSDFGFARRSIWDGGVGLFLVSGAVLFALSLAWLRGFQIRSKFRKYTAVFEFAQACGISTGTSVRIRGVTVGNVICVNPSLKNIEAVVEVEDDKTIIPRNSLVEVNQSGLLMETLIDITPRDPIPIPSAGPLDTGCSKEGLIVCDRENIKGYQGVSLDALVGIFTRLGLDVEEIGIANTYSLAERVFSVIEEVRPLLTKMKAMADDVQPLLTEVRDGNLLKEAENLTRSLTQASDDLSLGIDPELGDLAKGMMGMIATIQGCPMFDSLEKYIKTVTSLSSTHKFEHFFLVEKRVHSSIMTPENTELIQKSIYTLIFTLKNIENISSDILGFTGDEATRRNLKLLIKSLSRLL